MRLETTAKESAAKEAGDKRAALASAQRGAIATPGAARSGVTSTPLRTPRRFGL